MDETVEKLQKIGYQVIGADSHVKSRDSRINQTPKTDVKWSGQRGTSRCYPTDKDTQKILSKYGREYVAYDLTGEPDFSPFETIHVRISDMGKDRKPNFSSAKKRALQTEWAKKKNINTISELDDYISKNELTWHECSDGVTMRLVPTKINGYFGHSGGVSENQAMENSMDLATNGLLRTIGSEQGKAKIATNKKLVNIEQQLSEITKPINEGIQKTAEVVGAYGNTFMEGATDTLAQSAIVLTMNAVDQITKVIQRDIEASEAAKNITETTVKVAAAGGAEKVALDFVNTKLTNSKSQLMNKIAQNGSISKIITVSYLVKDAAFRYINGEIDETAFLEEVGENGIKMISSILGGEMGGHLGGLVGAFIGTAIIPGMGTGAGIIIGEAVGKVVGAMITTIACGSIISTINNGKVIAECKRQINKKIDDTIETLNKLNIELSELAEKSIKVKKQEIESGYKKILEGVMNNNYLEVNKGIEETLKVYGGSLLFETQDDFDDFFFSGKKIIL